MPLLRDDIYFVCRHLLINSSATVKSKRLIRFSFLVASVFTFIYFSLSLFFVFLCCFRSLLTCITL